MMPTLFQQLWAIGGLLRGRDVCHCLVVLEAKDVHVKFQSISGELRAQLRCLRLPFTCGRVISALWQMRNEGASTAWQILADYCVKHPIIQTFLFARMRCVLNAHE